MKTSGPAPPRFKDEVDPLDDFRGSADYKRDMAEVFARRAIEQALSAARRG